MDDHMQLIYREYIKWLIRQVKGHSYTIMLRHMHDILFRVCDDVPLDENREKDGRDLRRLFGCEYGIEMPEDYYDFPASFLEVLVVLARQFDYTVVLEEDIYKQTGPGDWFREMMRNVGLDFWTNSNVRKYGEGRAFVAINDVVNRIMDRRYKANGVGGLFPIDGKCQDQRKVELWYQLNTYIINHYG